MLDTGHLHYPERKTFCSLMCRKGMFILTVFLRCQSHLFLGPIAAPSAVQGHNRSSTSILVQWGNVPAADQNGVILSYTVTYRALPDGSPLTKVVSAPTMQATLTGLNKYTNYSITVFATTSRGNGNISAPIIVITDEDGKFMRILFLSFAKNMGSQPVM